MNAKLRSTRAGHKTLSHRVLTMGREKKRGESTRRAREKFCGSDGNGLHHCLLAAATGSASENSFKHLILFAVNLLGYGPTLTSSSFAFAICLNLSRSTIAKIFSSTVTPPAVSMTPLR